MTQPVGGNYRDVLISCEGRILWTHGWRPNLVVEPCNRLLAALMKGHADMRGILYWAVGTGEEAWDRLCPSPRRDDTQLAAEVRRQALTPEQIVYLDGGSQPSDEPTACLEVTAEFRGEDLVSEGFVSLREFGLFGGDATGEANSGYMIDYVIHPRIDLPSTDRLERKLRLTFAAGAVRREEGWAGFKAGLPVRSIYGVGDAYASALNEHGVRTLGELVTLDLSRPVSHIAPAKLREFQAKARLVMRQRISPTLVEPVADLSVSRLLSESPQDLARAGVAPATARYLQETLADLQIALHGAHLQGMTLGELVDG